MTDYDDIISSQSNFGAAAATSSIDDNPDDGAKALDLSNASGVPPLAVYSDLSGFQKNYKARLASQLVKNNPKLSDFVQSHPLAPVVANDDYGTLDQFSAGARQTADLMKSLRDKSWLTGNYPDSPIQEAFKKGFGEQGIGSYMEDDPFFKDKPITKAITGLALLPGEIALRGMSGAFNTVAAGAGEVAKQAYFDVTGDENGSLRFSREISALAEKQMIMSEGEIAHIPENAQFAVDVKALNDARARANEAYTAGKQWLDEGLTPPRGVHPLLDEYKYIRNAEGLQKLNQDLSNAQESLLRERSPEMFEKFVADHFGDSEIGIAGDRIAEMYAGREPSPDDGLLGWVPGIEDKLAIARETGEDVHVPVSDWIARVDPTLAAQLNDDIRVWPGGITKREAIPATTIIADTVEAGTIGGRPQEYRQAIDAPLPAVRDSQALEPLFSVGDRKLQLQRLEKKTNLTLDLQPEWMKSLHDFALQDQKGNTVGTLNLSEQNGGKQIHVDMISGVNGFGVRDFGPSLMRDLMRQIKAEFPNAEWLVGDRVSGAREQAGAQGIAKVKLDAPFGWDKAGASELAQILEGGEWNSFHPTVEGYVKPLTAANLEAVRAVQEELARIVPKGLDYAGPVHRILSRGAEGIGEPIRPTGTYIRRRGANSILLYSLEAPDMMGTARHEAIHHLRQGGFFKEEEWNSLTAAAKENGWVDQFNIRERYPRGNETILHEEAIADAYKHWEAGQLDVGPKLHPIFQKLKDFFDAIKSKLREIFGRDPTWQDLFEKVGSGEIGEREGTVPLHERVSAEVPERIKQAAIKVGDRIYEGQTHPDAYQKAVAAGEKESDIASADTDLFVTTKGRYISRKEAAEIAIKNNQTKGYSTAEEIRKTGFDSADFGDKPALILPDNYVDPINKLKPQAEAPEQGPVKPSYQDQLDRLRSSATGLDINSYRAIQDLIQKRYAEDLEAAQKRSERQQKQEQGKEWRSNKVEMAKEVEERLRARPDVAADLFFSSGDLYGRKLDKKYRLATDDLTDAQKAVLPSNYYSKDGLPLDQTANMFGFTSGDAMIDSLAKYRESRGEGSALEALGRQVRDETDRQMQAKYGRLEDNIMEEAKDQALSETNLNLLAEEMYAAAALAKAERPIDKGVAQEWAKEYFGRLNIGSINADRFADTMAKHGRDAERALLAGDPATALVSLQKKYLSALLTAQARLLRKEMAQFEKTADRFRRRDVKGIDPEYTNFIHQILTQVGKPVRRSFEDLSKEIAAGTAKDLEDFVNQKSAMMRVMPIMTDLYDSKWRKEFNELSVDEFRGVSGSVKALVANGRNEMKIMKAGEAADLGEIRAQMIEQLREFKEKNFDVEGKPIGQGKLKAFAKGAIAAHLKMETILNRWDRFDPQGTFNQYVMRDLIDGANQESVWRKEYAKRLTDMKDKIDLTKSIANPIFRDPRGGPLFTMNRGNLRAAMLNVGTKDNLTKLAGGYRIAPEEVMNWIHSVATKEDWDFVQKIWDNVFKDIKDRSDTMYRSLTGGVPSQDIPAQAIDTPHGRYEGGYYPIIHHAEFEGTSKKLMGRDPLEEAGYFTAMTPAGYMKSRTGYIAPLSLDLHAMPARISQMIHDIALRPAVINASKIFYDPAIRETIRKHYGTEYRDLLVPYLRDIANSANYIPKWDKMLGDWSEFIRQNMVSTLVGLNPGTFLKHTPTALVQSIQEVGAGNFLKAVRDMFRRNDETGDSNWRFAVENSLELQRRDRNWQETLGGSMEKLVPKPGLDTLRSKIISLGSKPVAFGDLLSAVPTWIAEYQKSMADGMSHGDSVYAGDRAVRRAHGSTAITDRPQIMRSSSQWITSVYNFFSHIMNRQAEMVWKAGETLDLAKEGEWKEAAKNLPTLTSQLFAYALLPALFEQLVSPGGKKEQKESFPQQYGEALLHTLSGSWIVGRDLVNSMLHGSDPSVGLLSTALKEFTDVYRDVMKKNPVADRQHAGKLIQDAAGLFGTATGLMPAQIGRIGRFAYSNEHPRNAWEWIKGFRYGTLEGHR